MNKPSYYGEGSKLPGGIDLNGSYPLDYRALINSWDAHDNTYDIDTISFDSLYTGMIVSDSAGIVKVLKSIPSDATKAHECTWEEIGAHVKPNWKAASGTVAEILNKPNLATVATSGSYNDLSNTPTIPTVPSNIVNTIDSKTGDFTVDSGNNSGSWNVNFTVDNNKKISGTVDHPTIPPGTVTSVSAGVGLTTSDGNAITSSGTVKAKLNSETSLGTIGRTSQLYAIGVDNNGKLAVNVPWVNDNTTYKFIIGQITYGDKNNGIFLGSLNSETASSEGTTLSLVTTGEKYTWNNKQDKITAVTHTALTAVGSRTLPVYIASNGTATATSYSLGTSVPSDAVFTDRYVNSASFADDTTNDSTNPVKMTLTRAGSDQATVTANLPKVSSSSAGVVPKGNSVSSQTQSTKFLREDGTWQAPSYTANTTYTFAEGDTSGAFQVTPSGGSATSVLVHDVLTSHQTIKQDGITGATINRYCTCSTAAATAAKTVSITSGTFPTLDANANGTKITVNFSNANTASTPTLNVNSKGAKNIYHNGTQITTGSNKELLAGVCDFVYDNGTGWNLVGNYIDTTYSTFGASGTNHSSGLVPDPGATAGTAKFLREDGMWDTPSGTGLTRVTFNGVSATVTSGVAAIKDNEVVTSDQSIVVTYGGSKYIKKLLTGGNFTITVYTSGTGITDNGAKEIIYRIDNSSSNATIKVTNSGTGALINMFDSDLSSASGLTLAAGKTLELVFTFWSPTDVTFNGGIEV